MNYVYPDYRVSRDDLHKVVEAQGCIAIGEIKALLDDSVGEDRRAAILDLLDVLSAMLFLQGDETRDCDGMSLYRDGTPLLRLVATGTEAIETRDYLVEADEDFDCLGDLVQYLSDNVAGYRVEVNKPPVDEPHQPVGLLGPLLERG